MNRYAVCLFLYLVIIYPMFSISLQYNRTGKQHKYAIELTKHFSMEKSFVGILLFFLIFSVFLEWGQNVKSHQYKRQNEFRWIMTSSWGSGLTNNQFNVFNFFLAINERGEDYYVNLSKINHYHQHHLNNAIVEH